MKLSERMRELKDDDCPWTLTIGLVLIWADEAAKLEEENEALITEVAGMRDKWTPPNEVAELQAENESLRVILYGSTGWKENEINERLALLKGEADA